MEKVVLFSLGKEVSFPSEQVRVEGLKNEVL
jgi:hypothetical protein